LGLDTVKKKVFQIILLKKAEKSQVQPIILSKNNNLKIKLKFREFTNQVNISDLGGKLRKKYISKVSKI